MLYLSYNEIHTTITQKLMARGCSEENARRVATVATDNTLEGVGSHGVNRVRRLLLGLDNGTVDGNALAERCGGFGGFEQWDGNLGIGILNALTCTDRAIELAREHGIGCVALRNTTHWFRGGTYGWRIAEAGMVGMAFTTSKANMVYYGTREPLLGTVPFVLAVPRKEGPVVTDVSMAEYSFGKLEAAYLAGEALPTDGGYDQDGNISRDPMKVMKANHVLPMGRWKGSALALAMDLCSAALSLGNTSADDRKNVGDAHSVSQTYIAIHSRAINSAEAEEEILNRTLAAIAEASPAPGHKGVRYPGESALEKRRAGPNEPIAIAESVWAGIMEA